MIEVFPDDLLYPTKQKEAIWLLQHLAVAPRLKKEALIAWCKVVDVNLTREMVVELLGDDVDRV